MSRGRSRTARRSRKHFRARADVPRAPPGRSRRTVHRAGCAAPSRPASDPAALHRHGRARRGRSRESARCNMCHQETGSNLHRTSVRRTLSSTSGFRVHPVADPAWANPLDPAFAHRRGGRWNPSDSFPTLCLDEDVVTARMNFRAFAARWPYKPEDLRDDTSLNRHQLAGKLFGVAGDGTPWSPTRTSSSKDRENRAMVSRKGLVQSAFGRKGLDDATARSRRARNEPVLRSASARPCAFDRARSQLAGPPPDRGARD